MTPPLDFVIVVGVLQFRVCCVVVVVVMFMLFWYCSDGKVLEVML